MFYRAVVNHRCFDGTESRYRWVLRSSYSIYSRPPRSGPRNVNNNLHRYRNRRPGLFRCSRAGAGGAVVVVDLEFEELPID